MADTIVKSPRLTTDRVCITYPCTNSDVENYVGEHPFEKDIMDRPQTILPFYAYLGRGAARFFAAISATPSMRDPAVMPLIPPTAFQISSVAQATRSAPKPPSPSIDNSTDGKGALTQNFLLKFLSPPRFPNYQKGDWERDFT